MDEPQIIPPQVANPAPKFSKRLAILLIILGIVIGAYFVLAKYGYNLFYSKEAVVPIYTPRSSALSGWKTYTNSTIGLTFEYPPDFIVKENTCFNNRWCSIRLENKISTLHVVSNNPGSGAIMVSKNSEKGQIDIGGTNTAYQFGQEIEMGDETHPLQTWAFISSFIHGEDEYMITFEYNEAHPGVYKEQIMQPIFSTFKFIQPIDTSSWKTYTSTKYGFELRYPLDWKAQERIHGKDDVGEDGVDFIPAQSSSSFSPYLLTILVDNRVLGFGFKNSSELKSYFNKVNTDPGNRRVGLTFSVSEATWADQVAYVVSRSDEATTRQIFLFHADKLFDFEIQNYNDVILKQVLSTFKFTK